MSSIEQVEMLVLARSMCNWTTLEGKRSFPVVLFCRRARFNPWVKSLAAETLHACHHPKEVPKWPVVGRRHIIPSFEECTANPCCLTAFCHPLPVSLSQRTRVPREKVHSHLCDSMNRFRKVPLLTQHSFWTTGKLHSLVPWASIWFVLNSIICMNQLRQGKWYARRYQQT